MPYSVPPPPLPPLINVQLPEENRQPAPSSIAAPNAQAVPEFTSVRATETSQGKPSTPCTPGAALGECTSLVAPSATLKPYEPDLAFTAEPLGLPMEVNLSGAQPPLPTVGIGSSVPATFQPLPDLDVLVQASLPSSQNRSPGRSTPSRSLSHRTTSVPSISASEEQSVFWSISNGSDGASQQSVLAQGGQGTETPPGTTDRTPDGYTPDGYTPAVELPSAPPAPANLPGNQTPDAPASSPPELSVPAPDSLDTEPLVPSPSSPPGDGQILTIPTPGSSPENSESPSPLTPESEQAPPPQDQPGRRGQRGTPSNGVVEESVLEVTADRQEYNERQQIFEAEGDVVMRFRRGTLSADRVQVNIPNRFAVAEGNAILNRGQQVLRGDRFDYSFGLNQGNILNASGQLFIPATTTDFNPTLPTDISAQAIGTNPSILAPLQVLGSTGGLTFGLSTPGQSSNNQQGGQINRLRFEAEQATFAGDQLTATNVRITNDPFSPPELELRANQVTYTRLTPLQAEIRARNPRLVFDQGFTLPLPFNRFVIDNREREPGFFRFGFDEKDRDGFFIERPFEVLTTPEVLFTVTPQILVQRAIEQGFDASSLGLVARLTATLTPSTTLTALANFSSLESDDIADSLRASARLRQQVYGHTVALEYSYRDRLFNGSLGFQDVQNSAGLVVTSPTYTLGTSGVILSYQGGVQFVNAQTDRDSLFPENRDDRNLRCIDPGDRDTTGNGCADLVRYQAAFAANRPVLLWYGRTLPATPTEGLRYSPNPITPYLVFVPSIRGVYSGYSNGSSQSTLTASLTLAGQFGHFSKPFLDYTAFNVSYSAVLRGGESPFLFDRADDLQVLSAGITQQVYGPVRFGVQTTYNIDNGDEIDTVFRLEYVRRTYSLSLSYSVKREAAAIGLQVNDFNWTGDPGRFSGIGAPSVTGGVIRGN